MPRSDPEAWRHVLRGPVEEAALPLLGSELTTTDGIVLTIVEVEAYGGEGEDAASHSHRGPTARNLPMFGAVGHLYVYRSYGIHLCVNIVCHLDDGAGAVLVRAGVVTAGVDLARARRRAPQAPDHLLASGPGRLGQVLGVVLADSGMDLLNPASRIRLVGSPSRVESGEIACGPRVGITREPHRPWRFWLAGHEGVSRHREGGSASVRAAGRSGP